MDQQTFRTVVPIFPSDCNINHEDKILLIGSCFSEHIADRFSAHKFQVVKNPFGTLYHPLSIAKGLTEIINQKVYTKADLFQQNELWQSWNHHSDFSGLKVTDVLSDINSNIATAHHSLKSAKHIFITLGTSWGYRLKSTGKLVANCHKFPNKEFDKELISVDTIVKEYSQLIEQIYQFNPSISIHFTISPVRHLRDGFRENQWSKSVLQLAVQQMQQQFSKVDYFPSYELVIDDLRDYRFCNEDMVHPNKVAIDYVWDKFSEVYFNTATKTLNKQITKLVASSRHRPFQPTSNAHQEFIASTLEAIEQLNEQHSFLDFTEEIELLMKQKV